MGGVGPFLPERWETGDLHFWSRKESSSHLGIPCATPLSVAGLLTVPGLFPYWEGFIPEVFLDRPEQPFLTFLIFNSIVRSYVPGIQLYQLYDEQAARDRCTAGQ